VTGSGGAAGSGGTIQNSVGAGVLLTGVGGGATLNFMSITGGGDDGVRGTAVGDFDMAFSTVAGNGNAAGESGLDFTGLTGAATFFQPAITGNAEHGLSIVNDAGTSSATVTGGSISGQNNATTGDSGINLEGTGSGSQALTVLDTTFSDNRGDHIGVRTDASTTVSQRVFATGVTMTSPGPTLGGGITVSPADEAQVRVDIISSTISSPETTAVALNFGTGTGSLVAVVSNNTLSARGADGVDVTANGASSVTARVAANRITGYDLAGIRLYQRDGSGTLNATVRGNSISAPGQFAANGLLAQAGAVSGDNGSLCLDAGDVSVAALKNALVGSGANGGTDFRVRQRFGSTVRLPGYTGGASDTAAVIAHLQARNDANGTPTGSATAEAGQFTNTPGGGGCPVP